MGRYRTAQHVNSNLFYLGLVPLKESTITDSKTGNKGKGCVWSTDSYDDADRKAMKDLQEQNEEQED